MEFAENTGYRSFLDPRTKLALLVTLPTFLMGGAGGEAFGIFRYSLTAIPFWLLALSKNGKPLIMGLTAYGATLALWKYAAHWLDGFWYILLLFLADILIYIMPCFLMSIYILNTTTASEFISGMEKLHIPALITIPLSVMFRFFPTIAEESACINKAMKMRGIQLGGSKASKMLEYRLIPMMMCSLRIGDELSAAALTRGLGAPVKRTNISQIGFRLLDILLLLMCGAGFLCWILGAAGIL